MNDNTSVDELPLNKIEAIITDHNKAMRTDMASEITGGTRSKAITDVITVKALAKLITTYTKQRELALLKKIKAMGVYDVDRPDDHFVWSWKIDREIAAIQKEKELLKWH